MTTSVINYIFSSENPIVIKNKNQLFSKIKIESLEVYDFNSKETPLMELELSTTPISPINFIKDNRENKRIIGLCDLKNKRFAGESVILFYEEITIPSSHEVSIYFRDIDNRESIRLDKKKISYLINYSLD